MSEKDILLKPSHTDSQLANYHSHKSSHKSNDQCTLINKNALKESYLKDKWLYLRIIKWFLIILIIVVVIKLQIL
jgi:hypothetical protein